MKASFILFKHGCHINKELFRFRGTKVNWLQLISKSILESLLPEMSLGDEGSRIAIPGKRLPTQPKTKMHDSGSQTGMCLRNARRVC